MNEFTKEELEYMSRAVYFDELEHHLEKDIPEFAVKLIKKLELMIKHFDVPFTPINNPNKSWSPEK